MYRGMTPNLDIYDAFLFWNPHSVQEPSFWSLPADIWTSSPPLKVGDSPPCFVPVFTGTLVGKLSQDSLQIVYIEYEQNTFFAHDFPKYTSVCYKFYKSL